MKQEDRVRQTKQAFRMALLHFLQEKPINKVTVKDLTEFTGFSRSTFYLYYQDMYALKEDLERTVFADVKARMDRHSPEELSRSITPLIRDLFEFADQNRNVFYILAGSNSYREFSTGIVGLVRDYCFRIWPAVEPNANLDRFEPFFHYMITGLIAVVQYWIDEGTETIDEIAESTARMVYDGAAVLYGEE